MIKIGLDVHGVITDHPNPKFLSELTKVLVEAGHEVHILTGPAENYVRKELKPFKIKFTHIFSIEDYLIEKGISFKLNKKQEKIFDSYEWDRAKADYCSKNKIDLHLDDSDVYHGFFSTPYARIRTKTKRQFYSKK